MDIDSGASDHMRHVVKLFHTLNFLSKPYQITLLISFEMLVSHIGSIELVGDPLIYDLL